MQPAKLAPTSRIASAWQVETVSAICIIADQMAKARPDFGGGVAVVGKDQDAARIFTPHADQIGDAVDQNPRLA